MLLRASELDVCPIEVNDDLVKGLRAQGNYTLLPFWLPAVPVLSCYSRAMIEEGIADNLGLIQFQFSTVKGVVALNVIQQSWLRGAHGSGVSSFFVCDLKFSS